MPRSTACFRVPAPTACGETCARWPERMSRCRIGTLSVREESLLERRRGLEEEHQHGAALGRCWRVAAALGADDEIAGGAFAFVIDQRAFEHECLLQILVHVRGNAGAGLELC